MSESLKTKIKSMRSMARSMMPWTFPEVTFEEEQEILLLKQRTMIVDGYDVTICYSEADYGKYFLNSLQIQSSQAPFVPFTLICKIGKMFLGNKNLSYIEFFRGNRKVYCWTVKVQNGKMLPPSKKTKQGMYEGFLFNILQPGSVDLF